MDVIVARQGALDVHKAQVTACVRVPGDGKRVSQVKQFKTTVPGLLVLADWLRAHGVTHVVMEATGDYWKPIWHVLEAEFELMLVNARDVKQVPGRKTDVKDAEWLCQLAEAGLLRASFVPPKPIRDLRLLTRYRRTQISERTREAQRLHKALEDTGIKLDCVATDILGKSGRAMLDALLAGTTDPEVLAELARGTLRTKLPALREALAGRYEPLHALLIGAILAHRDFLDEQIGLLSDAIEEQIRPFWPAVELLRTIPGVQQCNAEVIIAEIGTDMSVFPTAGHLASCPANVPATTSRPASAAAAAPAKGPSTSTPRSRTPRWPRPAPTAATCKRSTAESAPSPDTPARSARSSTRPSAPVGTCSPPASSTTTSAATTSPAATPNARPKGSPPNSNDSATPSRCRRPPHRAQTYFPLSSSPVHRRFPRDRAVARRSRSPALP